MAGEDKPVVRSFVDLARTYAMNTDSFFFIQVGANDGKIRDPIYELVTELGWHGILLEPQKFVFEEHLLKNYAGYNNLYFENAAIDEFDGQRELFKVALSQERWATGLASFEKSHIQYHRNNGYIDQMVEREQGRLPAAQTEYVCSELVTTVSFNTLLDRYHVEHLDLLQIDAEGYDYRIVQLFDFARMKPSIIQFESHVMTKEQEVECLDLLHRNDYLTFTEDINIVGVQCSIALAMGVRFYLNWR